MRINVYTEELEFGEETLARGSWIDNEPPTPGKIAAEIVTADYISSRSGQPMTNYGIRIYLKSHPDLHYVPPRDDDRSAVTFWCGSSMQNVIDYWKLIGKAVFKNENQTLESN